MGFEKIALIIAYNGKYFQGFQRQPHGKAIENFIENILLKNNVIEDRFSDPKVDYSSSGRTDKGVHAIYQVISFNSRKSSDEVIHIINKYLGPKIMAWGYLDVPWDFNARMWARRRYYVYYLGRTSVFDRDRIINCISPSRRRHVICKAIFMGNNCSLLFGSESFLRREIRRIMSCYLRLKYLADPNRLCLFHVSYPFTSIQYMDLLEEFINSHTDIGVFKFIKEMLFLRRSHFFFNFL